MTPSLIVLGASLVIAIFLVAIGVVRVVQIGLVLKARFARYGDLPVFAQAELARRRIDRGVRSVASVPSLVERGSLALERLATARESVVASFSVAIGIVRSLPGLVFGR